MEIFESIHPIENNYYGKDANFNRRSAGNYF
jgi:hypothetical protein